MFNGVSREDIPQKPEVHPKKDGDLMVNSDGSVEFLTRWERLLLRLRLTTLEELDEKHIAQWREKQRKAKLRNKFMRL